MINPKELHIGHLVNQVNDLGNVPVILKRDTLIEAIDFPDRYEPINASLFLYQNGKYDAQYDICIRILNTHPVEYMHQLQDAYKFVSGEELIITL